MAGFFEKLGKKLFGQKNTVSVRPSVNAAPKPTPKVDRSPPRAPRKSARQREPYFVQVGFDFGTAFSKCVCRDVMLDKAWVYIPHTSTGAQLPFLIHNAVSFDGSSLSYHTNPTGAYTQNALMHIKMALQKIGLNKPNDAVLTPFKDALPGSGVTNLAEFVELCAMYLLAGLFGEIKADIAARYPGHRADDYIAINMAIPVADANHKGVNQVFDRVLRMSWVLADEFRGHPEKSLLELASAVKNNREESESERVREACFLYPEVSANVQGFVRSKNSRTGLYLFSDTGAGTVDQSVFLFARPDGSDRLTYLHAEVLPLGSSHIEQRAAKHEGGMTWNNLERLRKLKESNGKSSGLSKARESIRKELETGTIKSIAYSKDKLINRNQINSITVIFGGGGSCNVPYEEAVLEMYGDPLDHSRKPAPPNSLFRKEEIDNRKRKQDRFDIGMPTPRDLQLPSHWMNRLSVAYGLSFEQGQLAAFKLPHEVEKPRPEEIWRPTTRHRKLVSKDDV